MASFLTILFVAAFVGLSMGYVRDNNSGTLDTVMASPERNSTVKGATCYDSKISGFINTGLQYYSHDMGQFAKYILDQIVRARYSGSWFVHAEMINGQAQGVNWQSVTNGDLFAPTSRHGCYYHDTQTYLIVLRY